jgi:hypothetical protein
MQIYVKILPGAGVRFQNGQSFALPPAPPGHFGVTLPAVALAKAGMVTWLNACPENRGLHG